MARSHHLRLADLRAIYRLVGECQELGADPVAWQTHLLRGLMPALGAVVGAVFEIDPAATPDNPLQPSYIIDYGWEKEADRERFQQLIRTGAPARNPILPA